MRTSKSDDGLRAAKVLYAEDPCEELGLEGLFSFGFDQSLVVVE